MNPFLRFCLYGHIWKVYLQHRTINCPQHLIPLTQSTLLLPLPPWLQSSLLPCQVSLLGGHKALVNSLYFSRWYLEPRRPSPLFRKYTRVRTQHKNEQRRRVWSERETRASDNNLELNLWPVNRSDPRPRRQPLLLVLVLRGGGGLLGRCPPRSSSLRLEGQRRPRLNVGLHLLSQPTLYVHPEITESF